MPTPRKSIVYLSTPRSGSSLLCSLMDSLGVFGVAKEWYHLDVHAPRVMQEAGLGNQDDLHRNLATFIPKIRDHLTSDAGIYSVKMHYFQLEALLEKGYNPFVDLPDPRFIYIRRGDVVAQAISTVKAMQTGSWASYTPEGKPPEYSFEEIQGKIGWLTKQDIGWESIFSSTGLKPMRVDFNGLIDDKIGTLRRVVNYTGEDIPEDKILAASSELKKQSNTSSDQWRQRYEVDLAAGVNGNG